MKMGPFNTITDLHDLGDARSEWAGIYSPMYNDATVGKYIHEQFLEDASHYVDKYQQVAYWTTLLRGAQKHLPATPPEKILDIGSGAGNTIFGLLDIYPEAAIIASDLSVPLLKSLKDFYDHHYSSRTCYIMQLNAEDLIFELDQFDLVVGGAILHHLFAPEKTLAQCLAVLKPGGHAVFFEPFEIGYQMIALILTQLLQLNETKRAGEQLTPNVVAFFKALVYDFFVRKGTDKRAEIFQRIDDKWLFSRAYFEEVSQKIGFTSVSIAPIHDTHQQFGNQINTFLILGLQQRLSMLPQWALDSIAEIDAHFTPEVRAELLIEGCIIFEK